MTLSDGENEPHLRQVPEEELFGELRRRNVNESTLRIALGLPPFYVPSPPDLRLWALKILGVLTGVLVVFIGVLAFQSKDIPDLLSGLAGSGVGAIAGILSGGQPVDREG